jgi:hypothetical protein
VIEAALMYVYAQRVYPLAFSRIRLGAALVTFGGVLWVTQIHWESWRLAIFGLTLLTSLSLIVLIGRNEFASLLAPLRRKSLGITTDGPEAGSFVKTAGQVAPTIIE